jgi:transcriptional regulator with XRE-family HTH domain
MQTMNGNARDVDVVAEKGYAIAVGTRLRAIRGQKRLSLQDVEARSDEEFKASVLGAYERGERAISVGRLQKLARFYQVPVDQLLPNDDRPTPDSLAEMVLDGPIRIDLAALARIEGLEGELLRRLARAIQVQRGDFNGVVLTVRGSDTALLASILGVHPEAMRPHLAELGLVYRNAA